MALLFCKLCHVGYASIGEIPPQCPACNRDTRWTTQRPLNRTPELWTEEDWRLLKSLRIESD